MQDKRILLNMFFDNCSIFDVLEAGSQKPVKILL